MVGTLIALSRMTNRQIATNFLEKSKESWNSVAVKLLEDMVKWWLISAEKLSNIATSIVKLKLSNEILLPKEMAK